MIKLVSVKNHYCDGRQTLMDYTLEYFQKSVDYIRAIVPWSPEVAIVLGSFLGPFTEAIEDPIVIDYRDIPNFLVSTVQGHAGKLIFGTVVLRLSPATLPSPS